VMTSCNIFKKKDTTSLTKKSDGLQNWNDTDLPVPSKFSDFLAPGAPRTSLSALERSGKGVPVVSVLFKGLAEHLDLEVSPHKLVSLSRAFIEHLGPHPIEDLILFLRKVSRGEFGKLYNRLSLPDLIIMWESYDNQRISFLQEQHRKLKEDYDGNTNVKGLGTFVSPKKRLDQDNIPRTVKSMEWVLHDLYGIPQEKVDEILKTKSDEEGN